MCKCKLFKGVYTQLDMLNAKKFTEDFKKALKKHGIQVEDLRKVSVTFYPGGLFINPEYEVKNE